MAHYPAALRFVLSRNFAGYTEAVAAARTELLRQIRGEGRETSIASALIDKFGFDFLAGRDDDADPVVDTQQQAEIVAGVLQSVDDYEEELDELSEEEFLALYDRLRSGGRPQQANRRRRDQRMFFSAPEARLDPARWMLLAYWSVDEAAAISLSKNPDVVNSATMLVGTVGPDQPDIEDNRLPPDSPFLLEYQYRREQVQRAFDADHFGKHIKPVDFMVWNARYGPASGTDAAKELLNVLGSATADDTRDWKVEYEKQVVEMQRLRHRNMELQAKVGVADLPETPSRSLYRLVWGLAVSQFALDPKYSEGYPSTAFRKMHDALERVGMKMDVKTIKERIREAAQQLEDSGEKPVVAQKVSKMAEDAAKRPSVVRR